MIKEKNKVKSQASLKKRNKKGNFPDKNIIMEDLLFLIMFMLAIFLWIGIRNYYGMQENERFIGFLGIYIIKSIFVVLGNAAITVPLFLLLWSIHMGIYRKIWSSRMWGLGLLELLSIIVISIYKTPKGMNPWEAGIREMGGGYIGGGLSFILTKLLGEVGTIILLLLLFLLAIVLIIKKPLGQITKSVWVYVQGKFKYLCNNLFITEVKQNGKNKPDLVEFEGMFNNTAPIINGGHEVPVFLENPVEEEKKISLEEIKKKDIKLKEDTLDLKKDIAPSEKQNVYSKPSVELLTLVSNDRVVDKKKIKDSIDILEETFANFGIIVKVNQISCGPAVTRYELTPAPGVKVSRILNLTDDLQLRLAAPGIRIEAPIPGKSAVGIEIPNDKVSSVGLRNLLLSPSFIKLNSPLTFALGEDITGNSVVAKISDMPHLLIAGSTGSGKSVCINSMIMSFLFNANPEELKLVLIDPKMVELTVYNGLPHLLTPVVTDPKKAAAILKWMTLEMEKRYKLFAEKGVRDIYRYQEVNAETEDKLPFIVIIIDELADLMMVAPADVEDSICRLAQMARAAGIHLIVATQRPSVDVVTGIIKANIPSRIAFAVSSQMDSRTILDMGGAEKLLGKGDMLFLPMGANKPYRIQGAFVSDKEIEATVSFIVEQSQDIEYNDSLEDLENLTIMSGDTGAEDELYWDAVKLCVENQKTSISFLQRKLRIGYSRAARLMDMMEEKGIVSSPDNNKRRNILISEEQLEKIVNQNVL